MRTVNLLVPVPSIRNTLRPDGSYRKTGADRRPRVVIFFLLAVTSAVYAAVFLLNTPDTDTAVVKAPAPPVAATPEPAPQAPDAFPPKVEKTEDAKPPVPGDPNYAKPKG